MPVTFVRIASWVLFAAALLVALAWSIALLGAEATFGIGQVVAAGPLATAVALYLVSMPLTYGALGLYKSSIGRRFIAAAAIGLTALVYLYFATGF